MFSFFKIVQPSDATSFFVVEFCRNSNYPCDHVAHVYVLIHIFLGLYDNFIENDCICLHVSIYNIFLIIRLGSTKIAIYLAMFVREVCLTSTNKRNNIQSCHTIMLF